LIEVERTDFVSVPVTDMERAKCFYAETLGLPQVSDQGFPEFQLGENVSLYLVDPTAWEGEFKPHETAGSIALRVADVEQARKALEERGVEFDGETRDSSVCHMAFFKDSEGNALMLHRRYAPPA
jgi:catechol 2,3-dioxygenase-like lactoylglutathione lyase family enzyme